MRIKERSKLHFFLHRKKRTSVIASRNGCSESRRGTTRVRWAGGGAVFCRKLASQLTICRFKREGGREGKELERGFDN